VLGTEKAGENLGWETLPLLRATEVVWPRVAELTAPCAGMGWARYELARVLLLSLFAKRSELKRDAAPAA
jgi:hypothetical protein